MKAPQWDPEQGLAASAGGWPEGPVWFEFPAPLAPCINPQPRSELPGPCLIWVLSPPRQHFVALKGRPGGLRGAVASAGSTASPAMPPPLVWPVHPSSCGENQSPKARPARAAGEGEGCPPPVGVAAGVGPGTGSPCPPRQPASLWFSFKTRADPLQSPLTKPGSKSVDGDSHGGHLLSTYCVCQSLCVHSGPFAFMADLRPHPSLGGLEALESHFTDGKISPERTSPAGQ